MKNWQSILVKQEDSLLSVVNTIIVAIGAL